MPRDSFTLRSATSDDIPELARVGFAAFRVQTAAYWEPYFHDNAHRKTRDIVVVEDGARMAGHASLMRFMMSLCGQDVPMRGVAAVSVAPEYRRRGVARQLMREALERMRKSGDGLSVLNAFRPSFYRAYGYGIVEQWDILRLGPERLPASALRRNVRRADGAADDRSIRRVYEAARAGTTGQLKRSGWWWDVRVARRAAEKAVYQGARGRIEGYVLYEVPEASFPRQRCVVHEIRAITPEAYRGLFGFLESLRDQYEAVELTLPPLEAIFLIEDYHLVGAPQDLRPDLFGYLSVGAMARIVDLKKALAGHPGVAKSRARGALGLDLSDPAFADQNGAFDVRLGPKGARVEPGARHKDRLQIGIDRLTQVYLGAASAEGLLAQGFCTGSARAAALLDQAFRGPRPFLGPLNYF